MRELRELKLPRLVEARSRRSPSPDFQLDPDNAHILRMSQSSMSSDYSPVTPTFSLQGYSRFPSSSSSLAGSPTMRSSIEGYAAKRPLTEVREEPHERDAGFEMIDAPLRESREPDHAPASPVASNVARLNISDRQVQADYDWCDGRYDEYEQFDLAVVKRPRAEYSPTVGENASTRIGGGIRNLSRKFTGRKDKRFSSLPDSFHENVSRSRAGSMRAPSVAENRSSFDLNESRMPQALSVSSSYIEDGVPVEAPGSPIDVQEDDRQPDEEEVANEASRTPLLPPVMVSLKRETEPVQSPLQSPKIAESPTVAQKDPFDSPSAWNGLPSPPLSTKPSFSSFHHRPIVPPSEIPPMTLADPTDRWAINLGHANFTIYPEPYAPEPATAAGCKQLRTDWELARSNFAKHLAHTQAHYSTTSKTYQLTEQKWAEINSAWRHNHEEAVASVAHRSRQEAMEISHHGLLPDPEPAKLPSIHGLTSEGKFPKVGDVGIVGPMEVLRPAAQRPARKRNLWAFLQGMFPHKVSLGRSTSS